MADVVLRPMAQDETTEFIAGALVGFAAHLVEFGGYAADVARRTAETEHARMFPGGHPSPGQHLFIAEDAGVPVGHLWVAQRSSEDAADTAFVYEVEVREDQRGRGYGRAIMGAAEHWASSIGASYLALNVLGDNQVARGLYESMDYRTTSVQMRKPLSPR